VKKAVASSAKSAAALHAAHVAHVAHEAHLYALAHPAPKYTVPAGAASPSRTSTYQHATTSAALRETPTQQKYTNLFRAHAEQPITVNVYPQKGQSETEIAKSVSSHIMWSVQGGAR
jgi:hypothetical protein